MPTEVKLHSLEVQENHIISIDSRIKSKGDERESFKFTYVANQEVSHAEFFLKVGDALCRFLVEGFNVTVFFYGEKVYNYIFII